MIHRSYRQSSLLKNVIKWVFTSVVIPDDCMGALFNLSDSVTAKGDIS